MLGTSHDAFQEKRIDREILRVRDSTKQPKSIAENSANCFRLSAIHERKLIMPYYIIHANWAG
jgi:hypothetical protein